MARKTVTFTATDGRDEGKQFVITEMSATQGERWAIRLLLAVGAAGIDIPDELVARGMLGLLAVGYMNLLKIPFDAAAPLLDEMMTCVKRQEAAVARDLVENDIEELATRFKLRKAIWELHTDFFLNGGPSTSESSPPESESPSLNIGPLRKRSRQ